MKRVLVGILAGLAFGFGTGLLTAEGSEAKQIEWVEYEFMCDANGTEADFQDYLAYVNATEKDYTGHCADNADTDGSEMDRIMKAAEVMQRAKELSKK